MSPDEAKELLLFHSFSHPNAASDPRAANGFLGSLRPFRGKLDSRNFHEVMAALQALAPTFCEAATLDREVIAALWGIVHTGRAWGVDPDGMLRRNKLITPSDVCLLEDWLHVLSYAVMILVESGDEAEAFHTYRTEFKGVEHPKVEISEGANPSQAVREWARASQRAASEPFASVELMLAALSSLQWDHPDSFIRDADRFADIATPEQISRLLALADHLRRERR